MNTLTFLQKILPQDKNYEYYVAGGNKQLNQTVVPSIGAALLEIQDREKRGQNVFIGVAGYTPGTNRKAVNVAAKQCFYLDLDCGVGKPHLDKKEAKRALHSFLSETRFLAPSLIVDSGRGLHIYWVLKNAVASTEWQQTADALKTYVRTHKLSADHAVTSDAARILRVPGTHNRKSDTPQLCKVALDLNRSYSYEEFKAALPAQPTNVVAFPHDASVFGDNDDLISTGDPRPRSFVQAATQCAVLDNAIDTRGVDHDYNLWFRLMNFAVWCEDGEQAAHHISNQHPEYSYEETQAKYLQTKEDAETGKLTGATTCDSFSDCASECQTCPHFKDANRGTTWSSPIHFGVEHHTEEYAPEDPPEGWRRVQSHGKWYFEHQVWEKKGGEEGGMVWKRAFEGDIPRMDVIVTQTDGPVAKFEINRCGRNSEVCVPLTDLHQGHRVLHKTIAVFNVIFSEKELKAFEELLVAWYNQVQSVKKTKPAVEKMGWIEHDGRKGFGVGTDIYWEDGTADVTWSPDETITDQYQTRGDMAEWRRLVANARKAEHIETDILLASGFAAPLVAMTGERGCVLSAYSPTSGTGKTLGLRLAQSVWGHPIEGLMAMNDTQNMMARRLAVSNNLPGCWDEVRVGSSKEACETFVDFLYRTSAGKEKGRMKATTDLRKAGTWESMMITTSNISILDLIKYNDAATNAGVLRVFEMQVGPLDSNKAFDNHAFDALKDNYGHAGRVYAKHLIQNRDKVRKMVTTMTSALHTKLKAHSSERFLISTMSTLMVGAVLANECGLVGFDVPKLQRHLVNIFLANRMMTNAGANDPTSDMPRLDPIGLVQEFLEEHADNICVTQNVTKKGALQHEVRFQPCVGRMGTQEGALLVDSKAFKAWCQMKYRNSRHVMQELKALGIVSKQRRMMSHIEGWSGLNALKGTLLIEKKAKTAMLFDQPDE